MTGSIETRLGCGRRSTVLGGGAAARGPFVLPGTERRYAPDRDADILHSRIEVRVDPETPGIEGRVVHRLAALADPTRRVHMHAAELEILSVTGSEGTALTFEHRGSDLVIQLGHELPAGEETEVTIAYRGTPRRGLYFIAPDADYPDKPVQAWTQGQDEDSRHWFPCFDHPSEKMTTEVFVRSPSAYRTLSNGVLEGKEEHDDGTTTWHWRQSVPHPAYLVTLVVGAFDEIELEGSRVPLWAYVPVGRRDEALRAFGRTPKMIEVFERRFGVPYPYERYSQIVVEDFIFGGMENTTATTLVEQALYDERAALDYDADDLVAHELAHQWWGDLLTCRHWSHAWLNEGFATWSENVFKEAHLGEDDAAWQRDEERKRYLDEDAREYRRAIVDDRFDEPIDLFDRHLYEKGGWVVHMMRQELGEQPFWRAIRMYAEQNREGSVITENLRSAVASATGRNLDWFFDQWVFRGGHPELEISWSHDADDGLLAVTVKQTQKGDEITPEAFRFGLEVDVEVGQQIERHVLDVRRREETLHVPCKNPPDSVRVDPRNHLLATWKVERPAAEHRRVLKDAAEVIARARAAGELAKDASTQTAEALGAALRDRFWGVASAAADALATMRTPKARDVLVEALGTVEHPKARRAVARALGSFRHDVVAADALIAKLEAGDESLFVEATVAEALGRTRDARARELLEELLATQDSWADTIRVGAVRGLGLTTDDDAFEAMRGALARGRSPRLRMGAALALAAAGRRRVQRAPVREVLEDALDDPDFRVLMAAIVALEGLGDEAAAGALGRTAEQGLDGRVRRTARVAAARLRKSADRTTEVAKLSETLDETTARLAKLTARLERLEKLSEHGDHADA